MTGVINARHSTAQEKALMPLKSTSNMSSPPYTNEVPWMRTSVFGKSSPGIRHQGANPEAINSRPQKINPSEDHESRG